MQQGNEIVTISVVVPVYSGERYLADLVGQIHALKEKWSSAGVELLINEALFILDSPIDNSRDVLAPLAKQYPWLRIIELSRNFGQHSATVTGILYSSGDWVVTMDEDLQHQPVDIETLLKQACSERADVVYASAKKGVHGGGYRDRLSRLAKFLVASFTGNQFVQSFNSFRLIRGDIARAASSICAQYTYFDVALTWFTQRISTVTLKMTDQRYLNQKASGYRFYTLLQHAKRLILTTDFRILRFTTSLSFFAFLLFIVYGAWILYLRYFSNQAIVVEGWTSLMVVILAFASITIFILGLIAEFLHMSMLQLQGKPTFFVIDRSSDGSLTREVAKLEPPCES